MVIAVKRQTVVLREFHNETMKVLPAFRTELSSVCTAVNKLLMQLQWLEESSSKRRKIHEKEVESAILSFYDFINSSKAQKILEKQKANLITVEDRVFGTQYHSVAVPRAVSR